jgi:hypothetical protein
LDPFLNNAIVVLSFQNMLLRICKIHFDAKIFKHCILERFEPVVYSYFDNFESSLIVKFDDVFHCFLEFTDGLAFNILSGPVVDILQDCCEEQ